MSAGAVADLLCDLRLVDGHCHPLLAGPVDPAGFERSCTEGQWFPAAGASAWDSPVGLAIRRWCTPPLDLPPFAPPADFLEQRAALGLAEVTSRLLGAARLSHLLVDTGLNGPELAEPAALAPAAGARVAEVVRLERVAEELADSGVTPDGFAAAYVDRLGAATHRAVAVKSVVAYRDGLNVDPARPQPKEVRAAAEKWLDGSGRRLDDPVLLRFVLWTGIDLGLPLQVHSGFGDRDLQLRRADPVLLQPFLAAVEPTGVRVVLLHCYPYHRQAGWLASVYPHVYVDVGLTVGQVGVSGEAILGECLELTPFSKLLFSTDGYRLPELYLVGAAQFRDSLARLLDGWVREGAAAAGDAVRLARMVAVENARRVYPRLLR